MTTLLQMAAINALTVLPLAAMAYALGRLARRPALTHTLWVVVLLKFVTPPLFSLPVGIEVPVVELRVDPIPVQRAFASADDNLDELAAASAVRTSTFAENSTLPELARQDVPRSESASLVERSEMPRTDVRAAAFFAGVWKAASSVWTQRPSIRSTVFGIWMSGALAWLALQIVRAVRFQRRVVRGAKTNDDFQQHAKLIGFEMGLLRIPQVLIVDAAISPMLWGCGSRAKLLFPSDLADRLDEEARATLLTHELAHFTRGDHWVRLLELIVTGLFWWHPVVWMARHQIEEAEEECCDAWVVGQFPHAPRQYAEALLDTIDFLCERRQALPPVACGLGHANFLRHRLTKIMRGAAPKALSQRIRFAVTLVAALLLPLQPFVFGSAGRSRVEPVLAKVVDFTQAEARDISGQKSERPSGRVQSVGDLESAESPELPAISEPSSLASSRRAKRGEKTWSTAASADGRFVVRATTGRRVILTDVNSNRETDLSDERITAVAFAPDGEWFAAVHQDGRVTLWNSARGELQRIVRTHDDVLRSVAISPRGDLVAAAGRDGSVLMIDLATHDLRINLPKFSNAVNCVRFSPDGRQLAIAVGDWNSNDRGEVAFIDSATGQIQITLTCAGAPGALTFASKDELIVGLWDGRTHLWNLVNRHVVGSAAADKSVVSAAAFSADNPALREATFIAEEPNSANDSSPLTLLRELLAVPQGQ